MTSTVPEAVAPASDSAPDFTCPAEQARRILAAADLIERDGLHCSEFWDTDEGPYRPGIPVCTVAALAVACDVDLNYGPVSFGDFRPVLDTVANALNCVDLLGEPEVHQVYAWSDSARGDQVVARLRDIAYELRASVA